MQVDYYAVIPIAIGSEGSAQLTTNNEQPTTDSSAPLTTINQQPTTVKGAIVTLTSLKKPRTKTTNTIGRASFHSVKFPEKVTIKVEVEGKETVMREVEVKEGKRNVVEVLITN